MQIEVSSRAYHVRRHHRCPPCRTSWRCSRPREFETVGGFVTALLGRIPRAGDQVRVGELELSVHEVHRRRVLTVDLGVRAPVAASVEEKP